MALVSDAACGSDDMTAVNKQKQVNDVMKRLLFDDMDKDGSYFSYFFLEKIFGGTRKCRFCGAYGSGKVPRSDKLELYVTESSVVGKQEVECVRCGKVDVITSCDRPEDVPSDQRLRIQGMEVRYYCKKITHFEVLHDLMELLHIAAIEDPKQRRDKHIEVSSFMMQKARRVCEEWCKAEYSELRYKKFLRLHEETLIKADHKAAHHPDASEEYKEMYQMMARSFRDNREKVASLIELMKESLFDNPTRPSFMLWLGIAMKHVDQFNEFQRLYDHRSFMRTESSIYSILKERYVSLNVPVGIKKIPVVFLLFELPRFFHYADFITLRMGKKKPHTFLTGDEKAKLRNIEQEIMRMRRPRFLLSKELDEPGGDPSKPGKITIHTVKDTESDFDLSVRAVELAKMAPSRDLPPRVVSGEQFRNSLVEHLTFKGPQHPDYDPPWKDSVKVVLKIETTGYRGEPDMLDVMDKLNTDLTVAKIEPGSNSSDHASTKKAAKVDSQSSLEEKTSSLTTHKPSVPHSSAFSSVVIPKPSGFGATRVTVPVAGTVFSSSLVPIGVSSTRPKESDFESSDESSDDSDFDEESYTSSRALAKMVRERFDEKNSLFLPTARAGTMGEINKAVDPANQDEFLHYLSQCRVVPRAGLKNEDFSDLPGQIFDEGRDLEIAVEIPISGPQGEFSVTPMLFAMDQNGGTIPIMPVIAEGLDKDPKDTEITTACMKLISGLFSLPLGEATEKQKEVFQKYVEVGMAAARNPSLFGTSRLGAIKDILVQERCTIVRLNMADIVREAAREDMKEQKYLRKKKKREAKEAKLAALVGRAQAMVEEGRVAGEV